MSRPTDAAFVHEVRVGWGDCDPAAIVYTARIPAWSLEALDAWWEAHLDGNGWYQLNLDHGIGSPFVHMSFDFTAPITARHRLMCEVTPVRMGSSSFEFRVDGRQEGRQCFSGRFVQVFVRSEGHAEKMPAPDWIREAFEASTSQS